MQLDPKQWQRSFCDWQDMTLLDDIERNVDYYCVGLSSWNKLSTWFGAAPEIPIFQYFKLKDGVKEFHHDFQPLKVKVKVLDSTSDPARAQDIRTILVTPHLFKSTFVAHLLGLYPDLSSSKGSLFVVKTSKFTEGTKLVKVENQTKLIDAGLTRQLQEVCFYQSTSFEAGKNQDDDTFMLQTVAKHYGVPI